MNTPKNNQLKPQFIPFRCPICKGRGTVNWGTEGCKQCEGTGIYKVPVEEVEGERNGGSKF